MSAELLPIAFREDSRNDRHTRVSVFIGRTPGARGRAGTLTIRTDDWDELQKTIAAFLADFGAYPLEVLPALAPRPEGWVQ